MKYWLDLFDGTTWAEFRQAGANITGFNARVRRYCTGLQKGDLLLCYVVGIKRWVGALEVRGPTNDTRPIWSGTDFPIRFEVKPLVVLDPECGVPMEQLEGRLAFYQGPEHRGGYKGFVRRSPNVFTRPEDGELILKLLRDAAANPVNRPVDPKKLRRGSLFRAEQQRGKVKVSTVVSVPEPEPEPCEVGAGERREAQAATRHTEIQFELLELGAAMGFNVWVARNDRKRVWKAQSLGEMPRMVSELPTQFNEATNRTIELIDVLWLKGNSIVAAFEVECTTAVYSGLLRMSDLLALQPNLDIKLYLVAPDERRDKVEAEILRPTFKLREKPLFIVCGFLSFSALMDKVDGIRRLGLASSLKADFLAQTAEFFDDRAVAGS
jgi:hypothetical protein